MGYAGVMRSVFASWLCFASAALLVVACSSSDDAPATDAGSDSAAADTGAGGNEAGAGNDGGNASDGGGSADGGADGESDAGTADGGVDAQAKLVLTSSAFVDGGKLAAKYANTFCAGAGGTNVSPPLAWTGAPAGTQTFAVVMRDVTLGGNDNFHWTIFDMPAATSSLPEGVPTGATPAAPAGAKQIADSFNVDVGYLGPCPPNGSHEYVFTLYALSAAQLPTPIVSTPAAYESTIQGLSLASATLKGVYP